MNVGIVGLGGPGVAHATRVAASGRARVAAVADVREDRARVAAHEHGARAYADYREMLECEALDAVLLCTPHFVRVEPIRSICARGAALFCEKPPALTMQDAAACLEAIRGAGVVNSVGFMYRWARVTEHMRELLDGRVVLSCTVRGAWPVAYWEGIPEWLLTRERSGGPIVEQGVHLLDVARYVLRDDVVEAQAFAANRLMPRGERATVDDTISVNLRFAGGALGTHLHNWSHRGWVWEVACIGDDFTLTWDMTTSSVRGRMGEETVHFHAEDDPYQAEIEGFLLAVERGDQSLIRSSYEDAARTLAAALAAAESAAGGGRPVRTTVVE